MTLRIRARYPTKLAASVSRHFNLNTGMGTTKSTKHTKNQHLPST